MGKKKRAGNAVRDKPASTVGFLVSDAGFDTLCVPGYTRLSDNPEVNMAVNRIADLMGSMTIHLMQSTEQGDIRVKNGLSRKLDIEPSKHLTRMDFISVLVRALLLEGEGNQVTYPVMKDGFIESLEPLEPSRISFVPHGRDYRVNYAGSILSPDEILHFTINPDPERPWFGRGNRVILKDVVRNLKQAAATKHGFMSDQWKPSLIIRVESSAEEMADEAGRDKLLNQYVKTGQAGKPWVIPAEFMEVQSVKPLTLNDLAINDSVQLDKRAVAGIIGVPPYLVGVGEFKRDEWNNFISTTIMAIARRIEQELTRKLLLSPDLYFRFNPRALFSYDLKDMAAIGTDLYVRGIKTGNEVRDWVGDSPLPGLDELVILENYIPRGMIGDQEKLKGGGMDG